MNTKQIDSWCRTVDELCKRKDNFHLLEIGEFQKLSKKLGWGFIQYIKDSYFTWIESGGDINEFCNYMNLEKSWVEKNCK